MSSKRSTKYNSAWESQFKWLKPDKESVFSAFCELCKKTFKIDGSGISQVKVHEKGERHRKWDVTQKTVSNQSTYYF